METEQVRTLSFTESLVDVAGMIFGKADDEVVDVESEEDLADMMGAFGWS